MTDWLTGTASFCTYVGVYTKIIVASVVVVVQFGFSWEKMGKRARNRCKSTNGWAHSSILMRSAASFVPLERGDIPQGSLAFVLQ